MERQILLRMLVPALLINALAATFIYFFRVIEKNIRLRKFLQFDKHS